MNFKVASGILMIVFISCKKQEEKIDEIYSDVVGKYSWNYTVQQVTTDLYYDYAPSEDYYYFLLTDDKRIKIFSDGIETHSSEPFYQINISADYMSFICLINSEEERFSFSRNPYNGFWEECGHHDLFDEIPCNGIRSYFEKIE